MLTVNEIIDCVLGNRIPIELSKKSQCIKEIERVLSSLSSVVAMMIAHAFIYNFKGHDDEWIAWVDEEFKYSRFHRSHLYNVGAMLLYFQEKNNEAFQLLSRVSFDKALAISRLHRHIGDDAVTSFIDKYDVTSMNRDEVIAAVNSTPGIEPGNKPGGKRVDDGVEGMMQMEFDFTRSVLMIADSTSKTDVESFVNSPDLDRDAARKVVDSGLTIFHCGLTRYEKRGGDGFDLEFLEGIDKVLKVEAEKIATFIKQEKSLAEMAGQKGA